MGDFQGKEKVLFELHGLGKMEVPQKEYRGHELTQGSGPGTTRHRPWYVPQLIGSIQGQNRMRLMAV